MIPATPTVSIVIPTYNHGHLIKRCLDSVVAQTYPDWEAIVVNNFSEDDTEGVVLAVNDQRIRLVNFRNHGVIAASRNEGIRMSRGEHIAFLDSDDWWYPDKLEGVIRELASADIVFHDLDIVTPRGRRIFKRVKGRRLRRPVFTDLLIRGNPLANSSVVVRKALVDAVGGLSIDPEFVSVEDFDLWLELSKRTERFRYVDRSLGAYWQDGANVFSVSDRQVRCFDALYAKHMPRLEGPNRLLARRHHCFIKGWFFYKMGRTDDALKLLVESTRAASMAVRGWSLYRIGCILMKNNFQHRR